MKKININYILKQMPTMYEVQRRDLKKCAYLMARAFHDDPSIRHLLGGTEQGHNDWKYFYTVVKSVFGKCIMISNDNEINDLLILFPPTLKAVPTVPFFINGGVKLPALFKKGLLVRSLKYETNCKRIKEKIISKDTWYCMCFVVNPKFQGKGRGSRLIKSAINALDNYNIPIYLETHKSINVDIYKHLGFEVKSTVMIPNTVIVQYGMLYRAREH